MAKKIPMKQRINDLLRGSNDEFRAYTDASNVGQYLYDIFFWQEVEELAKAQLKKAWAQAQSENGPIGNDDVLRDQGSGEHIVAESDKFSCLITVQEPRQNFDRAMFITALVKAYKIKLHALELLASECKSETKAPLTKRVVEA